MESKEPRIDCPRNDLRSVYISHKSAQESWKWRLKEQVRPEGSSYFPSGLTDYEDVRGAETRIIAPVRVFPYALALCASSSGRDCENHQDPNKPIRHGLSQRHELDR